MAIIDPDGLFGGDRLRQCSDMARLHWPYLFLAANGYGRLEIDYHVVVGRVYLGFKNPVTEVQFLHYIQEYYRNHLMFLYTSEMKIWGQFYCKPGMLPRHKTAKDKNSPVPPEPDHTDWLNSYRNAKKRLPKFSADFEKFMRGVGVGVGVGGGVGVGVGKPISSPALPDEGAQDVKPESQELFAEYLEPHETQEVVVIPPSLDSLQEKWFLEEFWPNAWRKVDRATALKAFKKHAITEERKNQIIAAEKSHAMGYCLRDPEHRPHMATWLNKLRYLEPFDSSVPQIIATPLSKSEVATQQALRRVAGQGGMF